MPWKVIATLLLALIVLRLEALRDFNTHFIGGNSGDAGFYVWLSEIAKNFWHRSWFDLPIFYPYGQTLAWSDNFLAPGWLVNLLQVCGLSLPFAYNLIIFGAGLLNGFAVYLLSRVLGAKELAAVTSGILFMGSPILLGHLGHPQLQFAFPVPFAIAWFLFFQKTKKLSYPFATGLLLVFSFLCSVYHTIFALIAIALCAIGYLIFRPHITSIKMLGRYGTSLILGFLPVIPFLIPYLRSANSFGSKELAEPAAFAANGFSFLASTPWSLAYGNFSVLSHPEAQLLPGIGALVSFAAAFMALLLGARASRVGSVFILCFAATLVFSIFEGGLYRLAFEAFSWLSLAAAVWFLITVRRGVGRKIDQELSGRELAALLVWVSAVAVLFSLGPNGPYTALFYLFPGADSLRAIGRFGILALAAAAPLVAFGIHALTATRMSYVFTSTFLILIFILEGWAREIPREPLRGIAQPYHYIAQKKATGDAMAVLPLALGTKPDGTPKSWGDYARRTVELMRSASVTGIPIVNGYSGLRPKLLHDLLRTTRFFPDERSLKSLSRIVNLKYLIFNSGEKFGESPEELLTKFAPYQLQLSFVLADKEGNLLFEFKPVTQVTNKFSLLLPPGSAGNLSLELAALVKSGEDSAKVVVSQQGKFNELALKANGHFEMYAIQVSPSESSVSPREIAFQVPENISLVLRDRRYTVVENAR